MSDRPDRETETSELGAAEAVSPGAFGRASGGDVTTEKTLCPYCNRPVEAGFKFCDWCGKPLVKPADEKPAAPAVATPPSTPAAPGSTKARRFSLRGKRAESLRARGEALLDEDAPTPPQPPPATEPKPKKERRFSLRGKRAETLLRQGEDMFGEQRTAPPPAPPAVVPPTRPRPPEPAPISRSAHPPAVTRPIPTARPAPPKEARGGATFGGILLYLVHLIVAFAAGALVLGVIAVIVAFTSDGDRTFLEMRGLPVFTGVAVSVAVFAVFRGTSGSGVGRGARAAAIFGMLVLVAVGVYLYRPVLLEEVQSPIERLAGIWSDADERAVTKFRQELTELNGEIAEYQGAVSSILRSEITPEQFRDASTRRLVVIGEGADGLASAAGSASNEGLRDALQSLADTYDAQAEALNAFSSGILQGDFARVQDGDTAFKEARAASERRFRERVRPLLERAGFDVKAFERAIES